MPALNAASLPLALLGLSLGVLLFAQRRIDPDTLDDASRVDAVEWLLAAGALAALHAAGFEFGSPVPSPFHVLGAYFLAVPAIGATSAIVTVLDLKPGDAFNPILSARSLGERAYFVAGFLPHVVLTFALPFAALPGSPVVAGGLSVAVGFLARLHVGHAFATARTARTAVLAAAFYGVNTHPAGGFAAAVVAVTLAHYVYVTVSLARRRARISPAPDQAG